jgi:serine/threonine protein kinase
MNKEHTWIKIVDFGIAGFCLNHLKEKTDAGTFKYMAPEVLSGEINLANPQMDIWALGVMMFLMLYGFHPFLPKKERFCKEYDLKGLI